MMFWTSHWVPAEVIAGIEDRAAAGNVVGSIGIGHHQHP